MNVEYIVAGLGNPGSEYHQTRHNAGFLALDVISQKHSFNIKTLKFHSLCARELINSKSVLFLKPQTYMNNSGEAIKAAADFYKIPPERIIVIYDDINFQPGTIRIRKKGSAGGHNGIKSIISNLSSDNFPRIKIGVGNKPPHFELYDWVLGKIPKEDQEPLFSALTTASDALSLILDGNIDKAMCTYN